MERKWRSRYIRIASIFREQGYFVLASCYGCMAVHATLPYSGSSYTVSHIPTGMGLLHAPTLVAARELVEAVEPHMPKRGRLHKVPTDWDATVKTIRPLVEAWGAKHNVVIAKAQSA
jgi:hypothetical protein